MSEYVVDVKPSARRSNGAVGRALHREGPRRAFDSRADADEWAVALSEEGERRVWVRDANPDDSTGADGYLVGRRPPRGGVVRVTGSDGEDENRRPSGGARVAPAAADQSALDAHADGNGGDRDASDGDGDGDSDGDGGG